MQFKVGKIEKLENSTSFFRTSYSSFQHKTSIFFSLLLFNFLHYITYIMDFSWTHLWTHLWTLHQLLVRHTCSWKNRDIGTVNIWKFPFSNNTCKIKIQTKFKPLNCFCCIKYRLYQELVSPTFVTNSHSDIDNIVILGTLSWCQIQEVRDRIQALMISFECQCPFTNISNLSPTHFVSDIDVAAKLWLVSSIHWLSQIYMFQTW